MRHYHLIVSMVCACSLLAGCSALDRLRDRAPQPGNFNASLASEYYAYAEMRAEQKDASDAEFFAYRGLMATDGKPVPPLRPTPEELDPAALATMQQAYIRLLETVTPEAKEVVPELAARTQILYECWYEDISQKGIVTGSACKEAFYQSLDEIDNALGRPTLPENDEVILPPSYVILFDRDSAELDTTAFHIIDEIRLAAEACGACEVHIYGHTDSVGTLEYNKKLAASRAAVVHDALAAAGIPRTRLHRTGYGEAQLTLPTEDEVPHAFNRRVKVEFAY